MREYRESESVDFAIVGTGAGGGTLAALLAEQGFSVIAFDAGGYFRPLEDFASDETAQNKLYWTDKRVLDGPNPDQDGRQQFGQGGGRVDRPLRDGGAALSPRMVQVSHDARLWRGLADLLGGDVALLRELLSGRSTSLGR